jgi:hypothetical protein
VRYLNDEDLEKYADTKVLLEPAEFTEGKMAVLLRTQELSEGYGRLQISTPFQGNGNRPTSSPDSRQPCGRSIQEASWAGTDWRAANSL